MTRVKRGTTSLKRRRKVLIRTKGFRNAIKSKERQANEALFHAGVHAFQHRRKKKREMRRLWQIKIGAASKAQGLSYSKLINKLKKSGIALDRKILSQLAENHPAIFAKIVSAE
jgi:large subunit ribosomal protein L20